MVQGSPGDCHLRDGVEEEGGLRRDGQSENQSGQVGSEEGDGERD